MFTVRVTSHSPSLGFLFGALGGSGGISSIIVCEGDNPDS